MMSNEHPPASARATSLPRITVVTPSYNTARFLEQCILSVLRDGYPDLEYMVVDGGSTDGSVEVIRKYEKEFAFWVSEPDRGQADAINKGFRRATGELVAWLNADDFYLPGALSTVAAAYRTDPTASFYFGDGVRVDQAGHQTAGFFPEGRVRFNRQALVFGLNYILQPAAFISRTALGQAGDLDTGLHYGLDTDLWIRLSEVAEPAAVPAKLAALREHPDTKTSRGSFERIEELRRIAERHSGLPMSPGALCYLLDALHRLAQDREDVYSPRFVEHLGSFWAESASILARFGAGSDGFPFPRPEERPAPKRGFWNALFRSPS